MTKQTKSQKTSTGSRVREALHDLLDRLKEQANELVGMLNPQPKPVYQPVPVRNPRRRS